MFLVERKISGCHIIIAAMLVRAVAAGGWHCTRSDASARKPCFCPGASAWPFGGAAATASQSYFVGICEWAGENPQPLDMQRYATPEVGGWVAVPALLCHSHSCRSTAQYRNALVPASRKQLAVKAVSFISEKTMCAPAGAAHEPPCRRAAPPQVVINTLPRCGVAADCLPGFTHLQRRSESHTPKLYRSLMPGPTEHLRFQLTGLLARDLIPNRKPH